MHRDGAGALEREVILPLQLDLSGKVVLVTGGARGVGAGIVESFHEAGAVVEICGRSAESELESLSAPYTQVDVREPEQVQDWISGVAQRRGRLDVAVNNAGGSPFAHFADGSPRFHRKVVELNLLSALYVAHAAHPVMHAQPEGGVLLNITSISARRASPGTAAYGAAKAGLENLTKSLAVEWAPAVRVNAVSSGLVESPDATDHYGDQQQAESIAATIPRGVFGKPSDVGTACVMLASPFAEHITGAVLNVDGGGEWPAFLGHGPQA